MFLDRRPTSALIVTDTSPPPTALVTAKWVALNKDCYYPEINCFLVSNFEEFDLKSAKTHTMEKPYRLLEEEMEAFLFFT